MQTKPVSRNAALTAIMFGTALYLGAPARSQDAPKAPPPIPVVLFDSTASYDDSVPKAVVQTRNALRNDSRLEVLLFSPSAPSFILASRESKPPVDLTGVATAESETTVAEAVGAQFYIVLTLDQKGKKVSAQIVDVNSGASEITGTAESPSDVAIDLTSRLVKDAAAAAASLSAPPATESPSPTPVPTSSSATPLSQSAVAPAGPALNTPPAPTAQTPQVMEAPQVPTPSAPAIPMPATSIKPVPFAPPTVRQLPTVVPQSTVAPPPTVAPPSPSIAPPLNVKPVVAVPATTVRASPPALSAAEPQVDATSSEPDAAKPGVSNITETVGNVTIVAQTPVAISPPATARGMSTPPAQNSSSTSNNVVKAPPATIVPTSSSNVVASGLAEQPLAGPATAAPKSAQNGNPAVLGNAATANVSPTTGLGVSSISVSVGGQPYNVPQSPAVVVPPATSSPPAAGGSSSVESGQNASAPSAASEDVQKPSNSQLDPDALDEISQGDAAMQSNDALTAISSYKNAIDLAPRAAEPRLKLAQAYLGAGMKDSAVEEAKRALAIDPGNADIRSFLDTQSGGGAPADEVVIAQAQTVSDPSNPAAWIALGDAYWNVNDPDDSMISYKRAADIDPTGILPQTRLAKLYAARAQYEESLAALQKSGTAGYPFALRIIASRSESLIGDLDDDTDGFLKGTDTREQFYDKLKLMNTQAAGLADFVSKITPPAQYSVSHLHRELSTSLLAQTVSVWLDFAETGNDIDKSQAADLEQHAEDEMKTASVAEDLQSRVTP